MAAKTKRSTKRSTKTQAQHNLVPRGSLGISRPGCL